MSELLVVLAGLFGVMFVAMIYGVEPPYGTRRQISVLVAVPFCVICVALVCVGIEVGSLHEFTFQTAIQVVLGVVAGSLLGAWLWGDWYCLNESREGWWKVVTGSLLLIFIIAISIWG